MHLDERLLFPSLPYAWMCPHDWFLICMKHGGEVLLEISQRELPQL